MIAIVSLKVKEGKREEVERALQSIVPEVKEEEGTLKYILHRCPEDPDKLIIYEKYRDKTAFDRHSANPNLQGLQENLGPLLAGPPALDICEEIVGIEK